MIEAIRNASEGKITFIFISSIKISKSMESKIMSELSYNVLLQRTSKNDIYVYRMEKTSAKKNKRQENSCLLK